MFFFHNDVSFIIKTVYIFKELFSFKDVYFYSKIIHIYLKAHRNV